MGPTLRQKEKKGRNEMIRLFLPILKERGTGTTLSAEEGGTAIFVGLKATLVTPNLVTLEFERIYLSLGASILVRFFANQARE